MTKIPWCDVSWNPVTGCGPDFECWARCYARRMANRLRGRCGYDRDEPFKATLHSGRFAEDDGNRLALPRQWKRPLLVFADSMGDLFHANVPFEWVALVYQVMADVWRHRYIILTKRPARMRQFYAEWWRPDVYDEFERRGRKYWRERLFLREPGCTECRYAFLGCLCARKEWKDKAVRRNRRLARTVNYWGRQNWICDGFEWSPVSYQHGVAVEMQNGEISVRDEDCVGGFPGPLRQVCVGLSVSRHADWTRVGELMEVPAACRAVSVEPMLEPIQVEHLEGVNWVICGPETGPWARPMKREWAVELYRQCREEGVPFFWKGAADGELPQEWPAWAERDSGANLDPT